MRLSSKLLADPLTRAALATPALADKRLRLPRRRKLAMGKGGRRNPPEALAAATSDEEELKPVWSSGVPFFPPSDRYWRIGGEWYDLEPFLHKHPGGGAAGKKWLPSLRDDRTPHARSTSL